MARNLRLRPWTEQQMADLSTPTPADIEAARLLWERSAPPALRTLLDAGPPDVEPQDMEGLPFAPPAR